MNRILIFFFMFFVTVASTFVELPVKKIVYTDSAPMGIGDVEDHNSWAQWNMDRLADPATGLIPVGIRKAELEFAQTIPHNMSRALSWSQIGPKQLGGRTRGAAYDVRDENVVIAGGVTGGLWKSVDGMATWYKTTTSLQLHSVTSVVQDKRTGKEDTWYAGTGEYYPVASASSYSAPFGGNGIYKSTDNGETWALLPSTVSNTPQTSYTNGDMDYVWRIVTDHTNTTDDVVLAAVYNGVFRSTNGGTSWTPVLGVDTSVTQTSDYSDVIITPSGKFYAYLSSDGPDKGVYRSTDGITWTNILPSTGWPVNYQRMVMAYNPSNENQLMFIGETPGAGLNEHSLFKYTYLSGDGSDTGGVWEDRSVNIPNDSCISPSGFNFAKFTTQGGYDVCIAWHPTDTNTIILGGTNVYRSTDQFTSTANTSWIGGYKCTPSNYSDYVYDNHHPDQHGLMFYGSNPNKAMSINDGGVYITSDITAPVVTWTSMNNGYINSQFYTVFQETGDVSSDMLVGGAQDNGSWFTNANHLDSLWKWVLNGDGSYAHIPEGRPYYIFSTQQGKMFKVNVTDDGDTSLVTRIDPNKLATTNFINPFIMDPNNPGRMYMVQNYRILRNDIIDVLPMDGNRTDTCATGWTTLLMSTVPSGTYGYVTCIEMSKAMPNTVMYGTSKGKILKLYNADTSTHKKAVLTSPLFPVNAYVSSISVNPFDSTQIMVTFSNYNVKSVFYSTDSGNNWSNISGNLEQNSNGTGNGPAVYWGELYPSWPSPTLFVGTSTGLYSTNTIDDTNTVWVQEGAGTIGNMNVNMIQSRPYDGKIVVATHGAGFYSAHIEPAFVGMQNGSQELFANVYPNPVSTQLNLEFVPVVADPTTIFIHNLTGQKVYEKKLVLILGRKAHAGIPVNDFAVVNNGTYVVTVVNGRLKKSQKIIVRK
ncbi:MAG TPA: T9SS type A sorting domain-containing protein [Flavobacteriales bacterium]|nr:T9SS type A sorting domain-containing protein [Flavobacteriales bacterium]